MTLERIRSLGALRDHGIYRQFGRGETSVSPLLYFVRLSLRTDYT